jgi:hypothetical protein
MAKFREVAIIETESRSELLRALAAHTATLPGQFYLQVRVGGEAANRTHRQLRAELGDDDAAIVSIPTLGRPAYWAALSGTRAAIVEALS